MPGAELKAKISAGEAEFRRLMSDRALSAAAHCALRLCELHEDTDLQDEQIGWARKAVEIGRKQGDRALNARALLMLGRALSRAREDAEAITALSESCELSLGPPVLEGHDALPALIELSELYEATGACDHAVDTCARTVEYLRHGGDRLAMAMALERLAATLRRAKRLTEARDAYQRAIDVGTTPSPLAGWIPAVPLTLLASVYGELGEHDAAAQLLGRIVQLRKQEGDRRSTSFALGAQGYALRQLGRSDEALGILREAVRIALEPEPCRLIHYWPFRALGEAYFDSGDWDTILREGPVWLDAVSHEGHHTASSDIASFLSIAAWKSGALAEAVGHARLAVDYARRGDSRPHLVLKLTMLAQRSNEVGHADAGIEAAEEAIGLWIAPVPLMTSHVVPALEALAQSRRIRGDDDEADLLDAMLQRIGVSEDEPD